MRIFKGKIENGKFELYPDQQETWNEYIAKLSSAEYFISIDKKKRDRSNQQNRYYWGVVVQMISDYTGYETEEVHGILAFEYLKTTNRAGIECRIKSTTELSTVEFEEYLAKIRRQVAQQLDLSIPEPNETIYAYEIKKEKI